MPRVQQPQDALHIQKCQEFCDAVEALIQDSESRAKEIELANDSRKAIRLTYIDAVLTVAERLKIDPDLAAAYLNPRIKEQLRAEYESRHMLPKTAKLPF